jgi:hypothetical protein
MTDQLGRRGSTGSLGALLNRGLIELMIHFVSDHYPVVLLEFYSVECFSKIVELVGVV